MNLKKLQPSVILFFLLVVFVGATLEDTTLNPSETIDAVLHQENDTTSQIVKVEQEENLVTGDIVINKENILKEEQIIEEDSSDTELSQDEEVIAKNEQSPEDLFNGLQPSLPGPKPE